MQVSNRMFLSYGLRLLSKLLIELRVRFRFHAKVSFKVLSTVCTCFPLPYPSPYKYQCLQVLLLAVSIFLSAKCYHFLLFIAYVLLRCFLYVFKNKRFRSGVIMPCLKKLQPIEIFVKKLKLSSQSNTSIFNPFYRRTDSLNNGSSLS